jgi:serine/threonine protein kinase/Tol biopolymer transport system component
MKPEQWQQVREVLADALELKPEDRPAFLDHACSSDDSLRREVERLLSSSDEARSSFLQSSALRVALMPRAKLGDYEVVRLLGSGGMGEVYRARDVRLGREVAIKVLPGYLSQDADRLRRFDQEARAAAALNHPNILAVFQMGTYKGAPYLVSELLEGSTLREQLVRGPMPFRKTIDLGVQIARGLAAAHEKGITHRDLKPENLFVTKDGRVKILDFGLAKLTRPPVSDQSAPTVSAETEPGVVMGTVGYMSPEQVRGSAADHRADIFAFGAILYEMLTGKRAFQKPTSAETMSAILNEEPLSISQITPNLPPALQRVVHRCLDKNPEQRFQSASDLAFALEALSDSGSSSALPSLKMQTRRVHWWAAAALVLGICAMGALFYLTRSPKAPIAPTLTRLTWDSGLTADPALSPDGKLLAYASDRSGDGHLDVYVQQVGGGEPLRLTSGPGDKREPAFSPDGTTIAFESADRGIYLVSALGGTPRKLLTEGHGPQFSPDGKSIAYWVGARDVALNGGGVTLSIPGKASMYVVDSIGRVPSQVRSDFAGALFPTWMADGRLLFLGSPDPSKLETADWWVTPLESGPAIKTGLINAIRQAKLTGDLENSFPFEKLALGPDGQGLVFSGRSGDSTNLWRIAFSPAKSTVMGPPQRLTSGATREEHPSAILLAKGMNRVAFASFTESLAVWSLPIQPNQGKVTGQPEQLTHDAAGDFMPAISRDGSKIVFVSTRPGQQEVWIKNLRTGEESALTATSVPKWDPQFSPNGSQVAFGGEDDNIFVVSSSGGAPELVCKQCGEVTDWSTDGKRIIGNTPTGHAWVVDLASRQKTDLLATRRWIAADRFSPDGRWFSFIADDSGGQHAYVAPTSEQPVPESAWISVMDGEVWAWSPDGNLLYVNSWRDGHECIWARRLRPATKQPIGEPFAIFHSHSARIAISNQVEKAMAIGGNRLVFSMGERTGNIWMAEWKEQ